jgi:hypothetical protein
MNIQQVVEGIFEACCKRYLLANDEIESMRISMAFDKMEPLFKIFKQASLPLNPGIDPKLLEKMYLEFIEVMIEEKFKIVQSMRSKDVSQQLAHFDDKQYGTPMVMWSQAQEKESEALRLRMKEIFAPLRTERKKPVVHLYTGPIGGARADLLRLDEDPEFAFMPENPLGEMDKLEQVLMRNLNRKQHDKSWELDKALYVLLWNALSAEYTINNNGEVNLFLDEGEIATTSVLWNTELNRLKQMEAQSKVGLKINFYMLTPEALKMTSSYKSKIKVLEDSLEERLILLNAINKPLIEENIDVMDKMNNPNLDSAALTRRLKGLSDEIENNQKVINKLTSEKERLEQEGLDSKDLELDLKDLEDRLVLLNATKLEVIDKLNGPNLEDPTVLERRMIRLSREIQNNEKTIKTLTREKEQLKQEGLDFSAQAQNWRKVNFEDLGIKGQMLGKHSYRIKDLQHTTKHFISKVKKHGKGDEPEVKHGEYKKPPRER